MRTLQLLAIVVAVFFADANAALHAEWQQQHHHHDALRLSPGLAPVVAAARGDPSLHFTPTCADPTDCTAELQAALDNTTAPIVRLTAAGSPWITLELYLRRSNVAVIVEEGAVLLAKRWAFNATGASLFTVVEADHVAILGGGTLRMWRSDYANPKWYKHAEWRMALNLQGVANMLIQDVVLEYSGGDGIYVTGSGPRNASYNVSISNVRSRFNYRQGMSVIAAQGLFVTNTVFEGTKGTPPMAGIDLEPDEWWQPITGLVFNNCTFRNNSGAGFQIWPRTHDERSLPYDVTIINSEMHGNVWGLFVASPNSPPVGAQLSFSNMLINDTYASGINILQHPSAMQRPLLISNISIIAGTRHRTHYPALTIGADANNTMLTDISVTMPAQNLERVFVEFAGVGPKFPSLLSRNVYADFTVHGPKRSACLTSPAHLGTTVNITCDAGQP